MLFLAEQERWGTEASSVKYIPQVRCLYRGPVCLQDDVILLPQSQFVVEAKTGAYFHGAVANPAHVQYDIVGNGCLPCMSTSSPATVITYTYGTVVSSFGGSSLSVFRGESLRLPAVDISVAQIPFLSQVVEKTLSRASGHHDYSQNRTSPSPNHHYWHHLVPFLKHFASRSATLLPDKTQPKFHSKYKLRPREAV